MKTLIVALALFALQNPASKDVQVIPVQGSVYMLAGAGANITAQVGTEGILLVDTGEELLAPQILSAIRSIQPAQSTDKPIFWTVDTSIDADHTAGNDALPKLANAATRQAVRVVAHQNVVNRMAAAPRGAEPLVPDKLWPNDEYFLPQKDLSFNGEAVVVYHMPAAHTDGESIVFVRGSNVLSVGDIFI